MQDVDLEDERQVDCDQRGPRLLTEKIKFYEAIQEMKNGKAAGIDEILA